MKRDIVEETSSEGGYMMEEKDLSRRDVLRGAMVVGFGLLVPSVFSGCDSKQGASPTPTSTSSAPANSPATSTGPAATTTVKKVSQASVQYQTQRRASRSAPPA